MIAYPAIGIVIVLTTCELAYPAIGTVIVLTTCEFR